MMMEWNSEQVEKAVQANDHTALYLYTPMCGTCQLAGRMLEITTAAVKGYAFGKANLNYLESLAERYQIESVPCLLVWNKGELVEKKYAFESVPALFETLTKHHR